jgi:hypothetical protein
MKVSLYFLFYVAMILEMLVFIVDRDTAEEELSLTHYKLVESVVNEYTRPPSLVGPASLTVSARDSVVIAVTRLLTAKERREFFVVLDSTDTLRSFPHTKTFSSGLLEIHKDTSQGNIVLVFESHSLKKGTLTATLSVLVHRDLPEYIPEAVRDVITAKLKDALYAANPNGGDSLWLPSYPRAFAVHVVPGYIPPRTMESLSFH